MRNEEWFDRAGMVGMVVAVWILGVGVAVAIAVASLAAAISYTSCRIDPLTPRCEAIARDPVLNPVLLP